MNRKKRNSNSNNTSCIIGENILVREVRKLITTKPSLIHEDASVLEIARIMVEDPKTRAVYVIDDHKTLMGIIPLAALMDNVFYHCIPENFTDIFSAYHLLELMNDQNAKDIMMPPIYVKDDNNLKKAIRRMYKNKLNELPVVDNNLQVIGDLNMLEILDAWIKGKESELVKEG